MKKIYFLFFLMVFSLPLSGYGADLKIGYVDFNKALNESDQGKKATAILEDMIKNKKEILSEKEKEIKDLDEQLKKQLSVLSPEAKKDKEDKLKKLLRDAQRMRKDFQEELQKKEADLTQEIQKELVGIVNKIAKDENYTIVFERGVSGILYFQETYDITDEIIKRYNETVKTKK